MLARWTCLAVAVQLAGCAQISETTRVHALAVPGPRLLGSERAVTERQLELRWVQRGDSLSVELLEHRRCQVVERVMVAREEHRTRRADAAIYWEYGLATVLLGLAAFSFARPDLFAVPTPVPGGELRDPKTGYKLGGVFMGLGTVALGAGIYDSVRARDHRRRSDVVELRPGPAVECDEPTLPATVRKLGLQLGEHRSQATTDLEGRARFVLPGPELWPPVPPAPADEPPGMDADSGPAAPQRRRWSGALDVGLGRSVAIEIVLPYDQTMLAPSSGAAMSVTR
ncbi:MAG TPA: hypothetical protein VGB85_13755 [Nannocystis sp.]|jgi:hypothetical protein